MKKIKIKIPAKINLTLDVLGTQDGFHQIKSLVASCNLYDAVTLYKRKDKKVFLIEKGISSMCEKQENNAVKTAKAFIEHFGTDGVTIVLNKKIPVGAGLGGSSADIAGVLLGMKTLFGLNGANIEPLAKKLGSDVVYMMQGGFAVISGKGDDVEKINVQKSLHIALICGENCVTAGQVYKEYDKLNETFEETTEKCTLYLKAGDIENLCLTANNALYRPSVTFCPEMAKAKTSLEEVGAYKSLMTGSGNTVFGIFPDEKSAKSAVKKLKKTYKNRVKLVKTI